MRYDDVRSFVSDGLTATAKYDTVGLPTFSPGPSTDPALQKLTPQRLVFLTVGGGLGLTSEEHFDRVFITVRSLGPQKDFAAAEDLAWDIDTLLLGVDHNRTLGAAKVLYVVRAGGSPGLIAHDAADRYHFQCTYVTETQTGF